MKIDKRKLAIAVILFTVIMAFGLVNGIPPLFNSWLSRTANYRDICVHEAYAIITYQSYRNVTILDVRSAEEVSNGYIAGAINIEWTVLEANLSDPDCPLIGHENDEIIVYCQSGGRSAHASEVLAANGFQMVYNVVGGINAWTQSAWNYPLVTEAPSTYTPISAIVAYNMIMDNVTYPDLIIVDVATPPTYAAEHIENAINIPYYGDSDFGTRIGPLTGHENDEIIVYCVNAACSRGPNAAQYLVDHGFTKVYHIIGGIAAWKDAGYPVVTAAYAHVFIEHTWRGDLIVDIGVGDPYSPSWSQRIWNGEGQGADNLDLTVDLSDATAYLPPSTDNRWFLRVHDQYNQDQGQIVEFTITHQGTTYTSVDPPVPINDLQTSYAYTPSMISASSHIYIEHTYQGDLIVDIGVGTPSSPDWSLRVWNGGGAGADNLDLTVDLFDAMAYLPPNGTNNWFLRVYDQYNQDQGQIVDFTITHMGTIYTSTDTPVPINDLQTSYAYIP
jgi:rhodanese-related sulfurtransferase/subtilisin-like proprotein convertase family protein